MNLTKADVIALERDVYSAELREFSGAAWGQVETRRLVRNWHQDAICDHLQAVSRGDIRKIIFNIPPRHTKSLTCNVFWPSWDWIDNPWRNFLFSSYRSSLSERDNRKANKLMASDWYTDRFDPRIDPNNDTNTRWGIVGGGERIVSSVTMPPALRSTCASPLAIPSAAVRSIRASMHVTTAIDRPGGPARSPSVNEAA